MSDTRYTWPPCEPIPFAVSADVVGGQLVEITGDMAVGPAGAASAKFLPGTAAYDAKTGEKVTVLIGGVQPVVASGAIVAGAQVVAAAGGKVKARSTGAPETVDLIVGKALTGGTDVPVDIQFCC